MKPGDLVVNLRIRLPGAHPAFQRWSGHPKAIVLKRERSHPSQSNHRFRVLRTDGEWEFWYYDECEVIGETFSE